MKLSQFHPKLNKKTNPHSLEDITNTLVFRLMKLFQFHPKPSKIPNELGHIPY